jgi:hypothetical protein
MSEKQDFNKGKTGGAKLIEGGRRLQKASTSLQASANRSISGICVLFGRGAKMEIEMRKRMLEWGVDGKLHAAFWKSQKEHVRNVMCGMTTIQPVNMPVLLSKDPSEAILQVMKHECIALATKTFCLMFEILC